MLASLLATILVYDLLVKRTNVTRFLFGMGPKKKPPVTSGSRPHETAARS